MTDDEKILTWLGFEKCCCRPECNNWISVPLGINRALCDMKILHDGKTCPDTKFDYLVMMKVRSSIFSKRQLFMHQLQEIWKDRIGMEAMPHFADAWLMAYLPGDYAEAARFMWSESPVNSGART